MIYHTQPPASQKEGHLNAISALVHHHPPTIKKKKKEHENTAEYIKYSPFIYKNAHTVCSHTREELIVNPDNSSKKEKAYIT